MNSDRLEETLRGALRPVPADLSPARDLWQLLTDRDRQGDRWIWIDLGLAAAVLFALLRSPDWLWLMAYHL